MTFLENLVHYLNKIFLWMGGITLSAMIVLTCANVFLRIFWLPVPGTFELMGYLGAVSMAFALGYTQIRRGHIAVDIMVLGFSKNTQRILNGINSLICVIFFAIVSWQIAKYATTLMKTGEVTETLRIIYYPFTYGVSTGCAILCLVFLAEFLKSFFPIEESEK